MPLVVMLEMLPRNRKVVTLQVELLDTLCRSRSAAAVAHFKINESSIRTILGEKKRKCVKSSLQLH